jgi:hypothetical protein
MYTNVYTYIHTNMHTYMICICTHKTGYHSVVLVGSVKKKNTFIHTHSYIHAYKRIYIHTYEHAHIHDMHLHS